MSSLPDYSQHYGPELIFSTRDKAVGFIEENPTLLLLANTDIAVEKLGRGQYRVLVGGYALRYVMQEVVDGVEIIQTDPALNEDIVWSSRPDEDPNQNVPPPQRTG